MKYKILVEIEVDVPDDGFLKKTSKEWADKIANDYAQMAVNYRSIGAETAEVKSIDPV